MCRGTLPRAQGHSSLCPYKLNPASQSLRFHIQLRDTDVNAGNLKAKRIAIEKLIELIYDDIGRHLGVDWNE